MKVNQIKVGVVLSYLQMGLGIVISLIYTPLMIKILGKSEYGLYNTVASTISMLSILNLGFNSSYIRFFSKYKENRNEEGISKLNGLFLLIFLFIGIVSLVCGLFLTLNLNLVFDSGLTREEYGIAKILMLLLTLNLTISFPMSVFSNIISAHEKFIVLKSLGIFKTVFSPLLTIPLLLLGYGSIAIVSVTLTVNIVTDIVYLIFCFKVLKVSFTFSNLEKNVFKSLFIYTSFIAINIIVDQINLNIDKILLGRFKGTESVAVYSVGYTLYTYFQMFSTSISSLFAPKVHKIVNRTNIENQKTELTSLFVRVGRIQFLILALIASGFVFFGKPFIIGIWAGEGYGDAYYVMLLLTIPSMVALTQNIGIEIQRAENKHWFRSVAYIIMAACNLILTVFLCQKFGAIGATIGTAISLILANGLIMNIYYHKKCNIDIILYWKNIIRMSAGLVLPIIVGIAINQYLPLYEIKWLVAGIVIYSIIYCVSMWYVAMNSYEKGIVKGLISKLSHVNR